MLGPADAERVIDLLIESQPDRSNRFSPLQSLLHFTNEQIYSRKRKCTHKRHDGVETWVKHELATSRLAIEICLRCQLVRKAREKT